MRRLSTTAGLAFFDALAIAWIFPSTPAAGQTAGLDAMLKRFDVNGNGQLDTTEVPSQYRALIDRAAQQAGLDTNRPISIDRLMRAAQRGGEDEDDRGRGGWGRGDSGRGRDDRDRDRDRDRRDRNRGRDPEQVSLVPGFGVDPDDPNAVLVPGFGSPNGATGIPLEERYDERVLRNVDREILGEYDRNRNGVIDQDEWREVPWGDDPRQDDKNRDGRLSREELAGRIARRWGFGERRSGDREDSRRDRDRERDRRRDNDDDDDNNRDRRDQPEDEATKTRNYAVGFIARYDKDKNSYLTESEWKDSRVDVRAADRNRDNRVDANELAAHWMAANKRRLEGNRGGPGGDRSRDENSGNGTYRFDTAHERLPKGTPSWFVDKDANEDGQVAMAEYSTSWSESTVAEFTRYDGNDDGIITPDEAMNPRQDAAPAANVSASAAPASRYGPPAGYGAPRSARSGDDGDSRSESRSDRERDRGRGRRGGGFFRGG